MGVHEVIDAIRKGYRHPKPEKCPDRAYELMIRCWNADPHARPSFATLHSTLENFDKVDEDRYYEHY